MSTISDWLEAVGGIISGDGLMHSCETMSIPALSSPTTEVNKSGTITDEEMWFGDTDALPFVGNINQMWQDDYYTGAYYELERWIYVGESPWVNLMPETAIEPLVTAGTIEEVTMTLGAYGYPVGMTTLPARFIKGRDASNEKFVMARYRYNGASWDATTADWFGGVDSGTGSSDYWCDLFRTYLGYGTGHTNSSSYFMNGLSTKAEYLGTLPSVNITITNGAELPLAGSEIIYDSDPPFAGDSGELEASAITTTAYTVTAGTPSSVGRLIYAEGITGTANIGDEVVFYFDGVANYYDMLFGYTSDLSDPGEYYMIYSEFPLWLRYYDATDINNLKAVLDAYIASVP